MSVKGGKLPKVHGQGGSKGHNTLEVRARIEREEATKERIADLWQKKSEELTESSKK